MTQYGWIAQHQKNSNDKIVFPHTETRMLRCLCHHPRTGSFRSLWEVKHEGEENDPAAMPVLCKAIRWIAQFLPNNTKPYKEWTEPVAGMGVGFPYGQTDHYAFDRLLEILHYGVQVYGVKGIYDREDKLPKSGEVALNLPLYSTGLASYSKFSSVDPDSGARVWTALGLYYSKEDRGETDDDDGNG